MKKACQTAGLFLIFLDEYDGVGGDTLLSSCETQFLCGCRLDGDIVLIAAADLSHTSLHGWDVGIHLRTLGTDGGVDIHQMIPFRRNKFNGLAKDNLTVNAIGLG